ncbi:phospholipase A [Echinimonas agarilytica]|uniref:Phospholipase A1 n=1 Tax=Echinimonas agarilytica TaxID=1215918 RepID=A0AA42B6Q6_9GAMM|nr:phospholipase A [Echinimonas agarilytica]MCM2679029.1 phospholipase A [Echinimonas agarilytica]
MKKLCLPFMLLAVVFAPNVVMANTDIEEAAEDLVDPLFDEGGESKEAIERRMEAELDVNSATDRRLAAIFETARNPFALIPYEQNYIMYTYTDDINKDQYTAAGYEDADDLTDHEIKYQLSVMFPLYRGIFGKNTTLAGSFTQVALWQATNSDISAPFRETNYEPQIFVAWFTDYDVLGLKLRWIETGFNHQSNGRGQDLSRSWNRVFANFLFERGDFSMNVRPWVRLSEDSDDDDNPDIDEYLGNHRLDFAYRYDQSVFTARTRYSFEGNKGSAELGWSYQLTQNMRVYAQVFTGYGETLIDYNHNQTRIGFGVMLNDLL